ncbi:hypothetical protein Tco_1489268 [Tanacetum coccineum]
MNIIQMTMQPVQVNNKFLNSLPPEWGKFVTDVKIARDLHKSNYDQLYSYLELHEAHANEACLMHERFPDPLALFLPPTQHVYSPPPQSNPYGAPHHPPQYPTTYPTNLNHTQPFVPQNAYLPSIIPQQPQAEFPQLDLGLAVPTFLPGDDLIAYMNKAMAFMSAMVESSFSKFKEDKVRMLSVQDHKGMLQVHGEIHQVNQRLSSAIIVKTESKELDEEQLAFLADPGVVDGQVSQTITHNDAFQTDDLDAYDSGYDDISIANTVLMASLSSCDSDVLSEVPYSDTSQNDMMNQIMQELQYSEKSPIVNYLDNEMTSDSNIIPYSQYLEETQHPIV